MKVEFQLIEGGKQPVRAHNTDAGFDLYVRDFKLIDDQVHYNLGVKLNIPKGYVGLIFPRSSIKDKSIRLSNSVGVIDAGYQGELKTVFDIVSYGKIYAVGERCCQIVFLKLPDVELELVDTFEKSERGEKGVGSSGSL